MGRVQDSIYELTVDTIKLGEDHVEVTASAAELNKLAGSGAVVASGTQASAIADPAETAAANAGAIVSIIDALQAFGIVAAAE